MATGVDIIPEAQENIKHLRRKYPAITSEVRKLIDRLEKDERPGDKISGVGYEVYKVRLPNPAAGRGKSGGFRVVYYVQVADRVLLLTIYAKTEQSDVTPAQIRRILEDLVPPEG